MLRIGWFATGRGEGSPKLLRAAVEAIREGRLDAEIAFVFSNRERGQFDATDAFFDQVAGYGIPLVTLSDSRFRREHGGEIARIGRAAARVAHRLRPRRRRAAAPVPVRHRHARRLHADHDGAAVRAARHAEPASGRAGPARRHVAAGELAAHRAARRARRRAHPSRHGRARRRRDRHVLHVSAARRRRSTCSGAPSNIGASPTSARPRARRSRCSRRSAAAARRANCRSSSKRCARSPMAGCAS